MQANLVWKLGVRIAPASREPAWLAGAGPRPYREHRRARMNVQLFGPSRMFLVGCCRLRLPNFPGAPHRNMPAARAQEPAGRRVLQAFFCDAVSARASICACKAFNTEERVGSIDDVGGLWASLMRRAIRADVANLDPSPARRRRLDMAPNEKLPQTVSKSGVVPAEIHNQKYISLTTFRKTGMGVATPVWFGEDAEKLYVMTRSDMGKMKRIRNNPAVRVAPCTMRGKVTGAEFAATARILPAEEHAHARQTINRKYWMARLPFIWRRTDACIELTFA